MTEVAVPDEDSGLGGLEEFYGEDGAGSPAATDDDAGSLLAAADPEAGHPDDGGDPVAPGDDQAGAPAAGDDDEADGAADPAPTAETRTQAQVDADELADLRQRAEAFQRLQEMGQQRAEQMAEQRKADEWKAAFERLPDLDESQLPTAANALVNDIRVHTAQQFQSHLDAASSEIDRYQNGLAALSVAIDEIIEDAPTKAKLMKAAAAYRAHGTPEAMVQQASLAQQLKAQNADQFNAFKERIAALEGEVKASKRVASGVDRVESGSALGASVVPAGDVRSSGFDDILANLR